MVLTREQSAELLGVSVRQLDRLIADGLLPAMRIGGTVRLRKSDLELFMQEKAHPFDLLRAALHVGLAPDSLAQLAEGNVVPHEVRGGRLFFAKPELERWRNTLLPRHKVYGHVDGMARDLRGALAKGGDDVELFFCAVCEHTRTEKNIAVRMCRLCGDPVCAPHSLHYLDGSSSPVEPHVACDRCYQALPRRAHGAAHALPGHKIMNGRCSNCCNPYPLQCACGGWIHAEGGTGYEGADAPVSKGPTCERCGNH